MPDVRVKVVRLDHSPSQTREFTWLIGRYGTVIAPLKLGTAVLVKMDDTKWHVVRRWVIDWDDLEVVPVKKRPKRIGHRLGITGTGRQAVQHAVQRETMRGLCGKYVKPLPFCGWGLTFSPTAAQACAVCVRLSRDASGRGAA
ncbi:hypothetical protein HII36_28585 [Nonomuraea sp. NN258]|uniref:hypothetical protein n=1 Tax=Nonomuraea antri TaxID=2730852 RepID=UPI001569A20D|nr:hypothetical protein [Nonomuraea antri]NRQ35761.1 hypothetical protein [Nonomuraea antri]